MTVGLSLTIGDGAAKKASFVDQDKTNIDLSVKGTGTTADLIFIGDNIVQEVTTKGVTLTGDNIALMRADILNSTNKAKFDIKGKGGDGLADLHGVIINVDNAIKSIVGKLANFIDVIITVNGAIGKFQTNNLTDTQLVVENGGDAKPTKVTFADAANFIINSDGPVDIKGNSYVNDNFDANGVTAQYVKNAKIKNEAAFALTATGTGSKGVSISTAKFGEFTGGMWIAPGDGKTFKADSIDGWAADFEGFFKTIKSKSSITNSDIELGSAGNIDAKTDITDSTFTFTDDFDDDDAKQRAFKKFKAKGTVQNVALIGNASFGKIEAGKAMDFNVRAGVKDWEDVNENGEVDPGEGVLMDALAAAAADFAHQATIDRVKIKGIKGDPIAMDNVFVLAYTFGKIDVGSAASVSGIPFGFAGVDYLKPGLTG